MNSNQNNGKDNRSSGEQRSGDRVLDDELNHLDQLYRSEELEGPPDLLDQAILNKAKQAVEPTNGWLDFGWIHGATTVALIVLTVSIVTFQRETGEFEADDYPSTSSPVVKPASTTNDLSGSKTINPSTDPASSPVPGKTANRVSAKSSDEFSTQATEADQSFSDRAPASKDDLTVAPMSVPLNEPIKEEVQAESQGREISQRQLRAPASSELLSEKKQDSELMHRAEEAQSAEKAQSADEEQSAEKAQSLEEAEGAEGSQSEAAAPSADEDRDVKSMQLDSLGAVAGSTAAEMPQTGSPQQLMLEQILTLKSAGDERWLELLEEFKNLYPDFPLPEALQNKD